MAARYPTLQRQRDTVLSAIQKGIDELERLLSPYNNKLNYGKKLTEKDKPRYNELTRKRDELRRLREEKVNVFKEEDKVNEIAKEIIGDRTLSHDQKVKRFLERLKNEVGIKPDELDEAIFEAIIDRDAPQGIPDQLRGDVENALRSSSDDTLYQRALRVVNEVVNRGEEEAARVGLMGEEIERKERDIEREVTEEEIERMGQANQRVKELEQRSRGMVNDLRGYNEEELVRMEQRNQRIKELEEKAQRMLEDLQRQINEVKERVEQSRELPAPEFGGDEPLEPFQPLPPFEEQPRDQPFDALNMDEEEDIKVDPIDQAAIDQAVRDIQNQAQGLDPAEIAARIARADRLVNNVRVQQGIQGMLPDERDRLGLIRRGNRWAFINAAGFSVAVITEIAKALYNYFKDREPPEGPPKEPPKPPSGPPSEPPSGPPTTSPTGEGEDPERVKKWNEIFKPIFIKLLKAYRAHKGKVDFGIKLIAKVRKDYIKDGVLSKETLDEVDKILKPDIKNIGAESKEDLVEAYKLMGEKHMLSYPEYNYLGPGTNLNDRLNMRHGFDKFVPINSLDNDALLHDIYYEIYDPEIRQYSDNLLWSKIRKDDIKHIDVFLAHLALGAKRFLEQTLYVNLGDELSGNPKLRGTTTKEEKDEVLRVYRDAQKIFRDLGVKFELRGRKGTLNDEAGDLMLDVDKLNKEDVLKFMRDYSKIYDDSKSKRERYGIQIPTQPPTQEPTQIPTQQPTQEPLQQPTQEPTQEPTGQVEFDTDDTKTDINNIMTTKARLNKEEMKQYNEFKSFFGEGYGTTPDKVSVSEDTLRQWLKTYALSKRRLSKQENLNLKNYLARFPIREVAHVKDLDELKRAKTAEKIKQLIASRLVGFGVPGEAKSLITNPITTRDERLQQSREEAIRKRADQGAPPKEGFTDISEILAHYEQKKVSTLNKKMREDEEAKRARELEEAVLRERRAREEIKRAELLRREKAYGNTQPTIEVSKVQPPVEDVDHITRVTSKGVDDTIDEILEGKGPVPEGRVPQSSTYEIEPIEMGSNLNEGVRDTVNADISAFDVFSADVNQSSSKEELDKIIPSDEQKIETFLSTALFQFVPPSLWRDPDDTFNVDEIIKSEIKFGGDLINQATPQKRIPMPSQELRAVIQIPYKPIFTNDRPFQSVDQAPRLQFWNRDQLSAVASTWSRNQLYNGI